ncbi:hypothetical protein CTEN210_00299 [Chaetoceros tenuissimus]|uniref:Leucine-rich repeat domain-containing protein n=1 Tax=Chaetoceros tenuissimus TaxID=426638 RepID=A0AAD3CDK6_9STRA|nr:hypothetical protein CTEN210_00299 [Chaetoceros tenuissimus]
MRVATVDGLVTLFYDGSKELNNQRLNEEWLLTNYVHPMNNDHDNIEGDNIESWPLSDACKEYFREKLSWQQVIVVEGVTEIPENTFFGCMNVKRVIFANTVMRIEKFAFYLCYRLAFIKWPMNLEYIGNDAFYECNLSSVFIPPRCVEICTRAFFKNKNLSIFHVPQDTELGRDIITNTAIARASPIEGNNQFIGFGDFFSGLGVAANNNMNEWLKNMNNDEEYALHRACSSFQPLKEVLCGMIQEKGLKAFKEKNSAGITPSRYLQGNPYADVTEKEVIESYILQMMGKC